MIPKDYKIKPGDKIRAVFGNAVSYPIIEKVTPKGFIKIQGITFNPNGIERTSYQWGEHKELYPFDEKEYNHFVFERQTEMKKKSIISAITKMTIEDGSKIEHIYEYLFGAKYK